MREQDTGAVVKRGVEDDGAERELRLRRIAVVTRYVEAVRIPVDMRHPQSLSSWVGLGEAACKEVAGRLRSGKPERLFGTLMAHEASLRRACRVQSSASSVSDGRMGNRHPIVRNGPLSQSWCG